MPTDLGKGYSENIRVLLVDLSKKFGGASVRALTLATHMEPGAAVIAGLKNSPVIKIAKERSIPFRVVGKYRMDPLIPFRLRKIIREDCVQVIDTQNIQSKFWGSLAAVITDVAFVSTLNSSYEIEHGRSLKGKFYSQLDRWTNFKTDRYIAVSESIRQDLMRDGISSEMIDLVTNAVEIDESIQHNNPSLTRAQIGIPEDAFLVVSVGRLVWAKGYDDFISAFEVVTSKVANAYAVILGDGVLFSSLTNQIKEAGLEKRIFLLGFCDQRKVISILKASNVFVLSSRSEGVPYALLEAAAVGLPILSTRCGGVPEILTDHVDALLVPVGDTQAIAAGIINLYFDRPLAQQLGSKVRDKVAREHSIQKQVEATRNAYQKGIEHKDSCRN